MSIARRSRSRLLARVALLGVVPWILWAPRSESGPLNWHAQGDVKWAELELAKEGKAGFTLLPPARTGINFTNLLDEWSSAANRVLENGSGVAVGDFDGDGRPDIFLCSLNDGKGHFSPVSWTGGRFLDQSVKPLAAPPLDWGLTATFRDINGDGYPEIYVCNDYWTPDRVWINDGKGGFHAIERLAIRHTSENSMGVDFADIDRDGRVDFLVLDLDASAVIKSLQHPWPRNMEPQAHQEAFTREMIRRRFNALAQ